MRRYVVHYPARKTGVMVVVHVGRAVVVGWNRMRVLVANNKGMDDPISISVMIDWSTMNE